MTGPCHTCFVLLLICSRQGATYDKYDTYGKKQPPTEGTPGANGSYGPADPLQFKIKRIDIINATLPRSYGQ